ncbi:hypothetical protein BJ508DRAFT_36460 [Ascobolus immersus RN42]|uniref:Uncharacterized protein n=1 Tax=Ascobolus immersus RN42 TaxID=1160509 RepID=A0A3N4IDT2_ASCIM|nr:hypothetical protein BJ508DRAFT_36460 [Ascobolus immersus RN42]
MLNPKRHKTPPQKCSVSNKHIQTRNPLLHSTPPIPSPTPHNPAPRPAELTPKRSHPRPPIQLLCLLHRRLRLEIIRLLVLQTRLRLEIGLLAPQTRLPADARKP